MYFSPYLDKSYGFCPVKSSQIHGLERWWLCLKTLELLFHSSHRPQQHPAAEYPLKNKNQYFRATYFRKSVREAELSIHISYITVFKALMHSLMTASSWLELLIVTTYMQDFTALLRGIVTLYCKRISDCISSHGTATQDKMALFKHCVTFLSLSILGLGLPSLCFYALMILRRLKITQTKLLRKS